MKKLNGVKICYGLSALLAVGFIINIIVIIGIYCICMLLFGLNKYEKKLVGSIFNKIFKRRRKNGHSQAEKYG